MKTPLWLVYAALSALCAALVGIFGKIGMLEVDSTLATTVRSFVMTLFLAALSVILGSWSGIGALSLGALWMIALSGILGAASWLFYFKAIQLGSISQVAPIDKLSMPLAIVLAALLLGERPHPINWFGILLITAGAYLAVMPARS